MLKTERILDIDNELITSSWQDVTDNLWKNNLTHGLTMGKIQEQLQLQIALI